MLADNWNQPWDRESSMHFIRLCTVVELLRLSQGWQPEQGLSPLVNRRFTYIERKGFATAAGAAFPASVRDLEIFWICCRLCSARLRRSQHLNVWGGYCSDCHRRAKERKEAYCFWSEVASSDSAIAWKILGGIIDRRGGARAWGAGASSPLDSPADWVLIVSWVLGAMAWLKVVRDWRTDWSLEIWLSVFWAAILQPGEVSSLLRISCRRCGGTMEHT